LKGWYPRRDLLSQGTFVYELPQRRDITMYQSVLCKTVAPFATVLRDSRDQFTDSVVGGAAAASNCALFLEQAKIDALRGAQKLYRHDILDVVNDLAGFPRRNGTHAHVVLLVRRG
jgi:hypothetical protein